MVPKKTDFYINFKGWTYLRRGRRYCNGWWSDQGMNTIILLIFNFSHHFFQVFWRSSLRILGGISRWIGLPFCFTPITSSLHVFTNPESTKPDFFPHEMCRLLWSVLMDFNLLVNPCQKHLFLHLLTHNMTTDSSVLGVYTNWFFVSKFRTILVTKYHFLRFFLSFRQKSQFHLHFDLDPLKINLGQIKTLNFMGKKIRFRRFRIREIM